MKLLVRLILSISVAVSSYVVFLGSDAQVVSAQTAGSAYDSFVMSLSPVAYWRADTSGLNNIPDVSGHGYTLAKNSWEGSGTLWETTQQPFSGWQAWYNQGHSAITSLSVYNTWTVNTWFKQRGTPTTQPSYFWGFGDWSTPIFYLNGNTSSSCSGSQWQFIAFSIAAACSSGQTATPLANTTWHQFTVSYSTTQITIYIDGVSLFSQSYTVPSGIPTPTAFHLGNDTNSFCNCDFSSTEIYNTVLTSGQINSLHGLGSAVLSFTATGNVCTIANNAETQSQPVCANAQAPHYLTGSLVQMKDSSNTILGSGFTDSDGHYSFPVYGAVASSTLTLSLGVYGPNASLDLGWFPLGGSYLITLPNTGPYQNTNLDFQYVVNEAANSTWWTVTQTGGINTFRVPCLNITSQPCSVSGSGGGGVFGGVAVALIIPSFGAVGVPTGKDKPSKPDGSPGDTFNANLTNPGSTSATVIVSNDQTEPTIGATDTTTVTIPAQTTTNVPVIGTGGFKTQTGEVVVTGTAFGTTTIPVTIEPVPISTTGQETGTVITTQNPGSTTVGTTSCSDSLFALWDGLGPLLECLFSPTLTFADLLNVTTDGGDTESIATAIQSKAGFAEFITTLNFICPNPQPCSLSSGLFGFLHEGTACWNGFIPWYDFTIDALSNTTTTWVICASDPIPNLVRTANTIAILLFTINGLVEIGIKMLEDLI